MLRGTVIHNEKASNKSNLSINGTLSTQNNVTLRQTCIDKYELKVGDVILYDGRPYETVQVYSVVKRA